MKHKWNGTFLEHWGMCPSILTGNFALEYISSMEDFDLGPDGLIPIGIIKRLKRLLGVMYIIFQMNNTFTKQISSAIVHSRLVPKGLSSDT